MQKWEYKTIKNEDLMITILGKFTSFDEILNEMGREGWELVGVAFATPTTEASGNAWGQAYKHTEDLRLFFKRPL